jgi:pyrroloquinoline quinone biosynthesis protein D
MSVPSLESRPRLAPGCRLSESSPDQVFLLMPEGALRLNETGLKIAQLCTGDHSLQEIVEHLTEQFGGADRQQVERETMNFLTRLHERRVVDFG